MGWRIDQLQSRQRYRSKFDASEAASYDALLGRPGPLDVAAHLDDLAGVVELWPGATVLDAGAGTGGLTLMLAGIAGLRLTAMEPAPAMLALLQAKSELTGIATVCGFCDHADDRALFRGGSFDVIISRQLANGLYDPLAAFGNWRHWLRPGGAVVVIDGLYGRDAWTGAWDEEVDVLPLAATQSRSTVPYLLEQAGLRVVTVGPMTRVNALPATRTPRYFVVARRDP